MNRSLFFTFVLSLIPVILSGQKGLSPGFIVTNNFDTIYGFIELKSNYDNSKLCNFSTTETGPLKPFTPADIKSYRVENRKYYRAFDVSIDSVSQRVFLEYLVDGIVDLYYLKDALNEYYFVEKNSELYQLSNTQTVVKITKQTERGPIEESYFKDSNQYKRMLNYLFSDSPAISQRIPTSTFAYKSLINITKDYHNSVCKDYSCIDYTKSTEQGMSVEPYIGIINSWMGIRIKTSDTYAYDINPILGANFRFTPFKGLRRFNVYLGLSYAQNSLEGVYDALYADLFPIQYLVKTDYSSLRIPVGFDYAFTDSKLQPYFTISFNNILIMNPEYEVTRVDNSTPVDTPFRKYQIGVSPGVGLKYSVNKKIYAFFRNEFEFRLPATNFGYILDDQYVLSYLASLGMGIKIR